MKLPDSKLLNGYFILLLSLFIFTMWGVNLSSLSQMEVEVIAETGREKTGQSEADVVWTHKTIKVKPRPFIYYYLKELGYDIQMTDSIPPYMNSLLIVIDPGMKMFEDYKNRITRWVMSGGNLLLHSTQTHPLSKMLGVSIDDRKGDWSENKIQKVPSISDTEKIEARDHVLNVRKGANLMPLFDGNEDWTSVLVTYRGKGKIVLTSNPEFFNPDGLAKSDNIKFLTRIIDRMSNQDSIYIYNPVPTSFVNVKLRSRSIPTPSNYYTKKEKKEYLSLWSLIKANPISWVLLQLVLGITLYFFSSRKWFSRPLPVPDDSRAKDNYLTGMSELYMRAKLSQHSARKILENFLVAIKRKLLLPADTKTDVVLSRLKVSHPDLAAPLGAVLKNLVDYSNGSIHDNEELLKYIVRFEKIKKELKIYG